MTFSTLACFVCAAGALAAASLLPTQAQAPRLAADAVARRAQDRETGRDSRFTRRMKLADRHNRLRERMLDVITLRGRGAPGAPAAAPDGDRLLIRFNYPNDIKGTSFLVWEHPDAEDERFLFLPSLGSRVPAAAAMGVFPMFLIPAFIVPISITLHVLALRGVLRHMRWIATMAPAAR